METPNTAHILNGKVYVMKSVKWWNIRASESDANQTRST